MERSTICMARAPTNRWGGQQNIAGPEYLCAFLENCKGHHPSDEASAWWGSLKARRRTRPRIWRATGLVVEPGRIKNSWNILDFVPRISDVEKHLRGWES